MLYVSSVGGTAALGHAQTSGSMHLSRSTLQCTDGGSGVVIGMSRGSISVDVTAQQCCLSYNILLLKVATSQQLQVVLCPEQDQLCY